MSAFQPWKILPRDNPSGSSVNEDLALFRRRLDGRVEEPVQIAELRVRVVQRLERDLVLDQQPVKFGRRLRDVRVGNVRGRRRQGVPSQGGDSLSLWQVRPQRFRERRGGDGN